MLHALVCALPLLLAVAAYGYTLRLPFFLDDGPHFMILGQTDGLRHWGDFDPFPFYRPLAFSIWKLFELFGPRYPAWEMHLLNLLVFGLAGVLAGQVARRLAPPHARTLAAVIGGCGFVLFPFSYQAVAMIAAFFHILLALGVLLSLWAGLRWLDSGGLWPLALCWLGAFIAAFSHESGVLIAVLLPLGLAAAHAGRLPARRQLLALVLPVWVISAIYVLLWLAFSPNDEPQTLTKDLPAAAAALMQGAAYPFVRLARPLVTGDADPVILLAGAALALAAAVALAARVDRRALPGAAFGAAWYVLAILPAALLLPAGYVLGQLRLALLASAGGALLWGVLLAALATRRRWLPLALIIGLLGVLVSVEFLGQRRADFLKLADWNHEAMALLLADDAIQHGALIINGPQSLAPVEAARRFLLGSEGVLWTDPSLDYSQQFWMNGDDALRDISAFSVPDLLRAQGIRYSAHGPALTGALLHDRVAAAPLIYVTQFDGADFSIVQAGGTAAPPELPTLDARFPALDAALVGGGWRYDATRQAIIANTRWTVARPGPVKLFVHVYCDDAFIAQSDGYPLSDLYPFSVWAGGATHRDGRIIWLDAGTDPACLRVITGLYDETTGERLATVDADGAPLPDNAIPLPQTAPN
ncbi:MAG: hypothetical protein ACOCXZ_03360 [Chloroflexota bacterium]